ncbi:hypothetical protein C7974DRAFT_187749 [Boeremia exigua]|uniref:uncharacterized protein n=1 Tax=Boeremia exigua TaxID=749465 RepID=UPI001E8EC467|nr:uncharacterized protein C7974DRAFT_187749 [Boeremia exigua]KAH6629488.1 hypothetical protein C7974DRAFT_187749 [Boeremia exigua]
MRPLLRAARPRQPWLLPRHPRNAPQSLVPRRVATTFAQNAAPVDLPRLLVKAPLKDHNSLATFIDYANRTNLSPLKSYYVGTHYEYTVALSLMRLGFSLLRMGGKNDAGIDLMGHWVLAPLSEPLPIIVQCKVRKYTLGPAFVRELEGSFRAIPPQWKGEPVLGLLVTTTKATKGTMDAIARSAWPMGFVMISRHGLIEQFVWNRAASERGLQGVGVTVRHTPRALLPEPEILEAEEEDASNRKKLPSKFGKTGTQKDIQLTWMGSPIFAERNSLDQETLGLMHMTNEPAAQEKRPTIHGIPRRGPGRPRKDEDPRANCPLGRKPTFHLAPAPRGGQIALSKPLTKPKRTRKKVAKKQDDVSDDAD